MIVPISIVSLKCNIKTNESISKSCIQMNFIMNPKTNCLVSMYIEHVVKRDICGDLRFCSKLIVEYFTNL